MKSRWEKLIPLVKEYVRSAKTRSISWELTDDQAIELFESNCYYCDSPPARYYNPYYRPNYKPDTYLRQGVPVNGIDRLNNERGYFSMNVVPCCSQCNRAKGTLSVEEFLEWARQLNKEAK